MPNPIVNRLNCIRSVLTRDPTLCNMSIVDGVRSSLSWYGFRRWRALRDLRVEPIDHELDWIDLGAYGLAWPVNASRARLVAAIVESTAHSNGHYYFTPPSQMNSGDVVVDVGACEGGFALESITRHGAAVVWCFEPDSRMANALQLTCRRNQLEKRVRVVAAAVGKNSGTIAFIEANDDPLASRARFGNECGSEAQASNSVTQYSLDDWAEAEGIERLDYIKVDAEGSDLDVLLGARRSIERWRPRLAVTTYHDPQHCVQMVDYLMSLELGYEIHVNGVVCVDSVPRPVMLHAACRNVGVYRR